MYSKWADAFSQFHAFAEVTRKAAIDKGDQAKADRIQRKQKRLKAPRTAGAMAIPGDPGRVARALSSLRRQTRISCLAQVNYALLSTVAADRLTQGDNQRMEEIRAKGVQTRGSMRILGKIMMAVGWERGLEPGERGPELPGGAEPSGNDDDHEYVVFQHPSKQQLQLLAQSNDTISSVPELQAVMYWIIWDLADAMKDIDIAPPIQSRMYQELSNGMYVIVFTRSPVAGPILSFLLFESIWCLNEVAKELENPFGQDTNDPRL
eukprot:Skav216748  [mRNA]  locus=scaffold3744:17516:21995:+ [translate_table: standard]